MAPLPEDPYKILGVAQDAHVSKIRSAYRKLVLKCHPDKVNDPALKAQKQDEFQKVQQAYELLNDERERQIYDDQVKLAELRKQMSKANISTPRSRTASKHTDYETPISKSNTGDMPPDTDDGVTQQSRSYNRPSSRPPLDDDDERFDRQDLGRGRGKHKEVREESTRRTGRSKTGTSNGDVSGRTPRHNASRGDAYSQGYTKGFEMPGSKKNRVSNKNSGHNLSEYYEYVTPDTDDGVTQQPQSYNRPSSRPPLDDERFDRQDLGRGRGKHKEVREESTRRTGRSKTGTSNGDVSGRTPRHNASRGDAYSQGYTKGFEMPGSKKNRVSNKNNGHDLGEYYEYVTPDTIDGRANIAPEYAQDPPSPGPASSQKMNAQLNFAESYIRKRREGAKVETRPHPVETQQRKSSSQGGNEFRYLRPTVMFLGHEQHTRSKCRG